MKRVWKPFDLGNGQRLYLVKMKFLRHPEWNRQLIVAARSPGHAARLIKSVHRGTLWMDNEEPIIEGYPLNVYQPVEEAFDEGI